MPTTTALRMLLCITATCVVFPHALLADEETRADAIVTQSVANTWIESLDDSRFHNRQSARENLMRWLSENPAADVSVGTKHASVEVRLATTEIVRQVRHQQLETHLRRITDDTRDSLPEDWLGWHDFRKLSGDDLPARRVFVSLCRDFPRYFAPSRIQTPAADNQIDPYRATSSNLSLWTAVMVWQTRNENDATSDQQSQTDPQQQAHREMRLAMALSNPSLGPNIDSRCEGASKADRDQSIVMRRLIARWLSNGLATIDARTGLSIAVRYQCTNEVHRRCEEVFANPESPASTVVMAMLAAAKCERPNLPWSVVSDELIARLSDDRKAHTWQMITARKIKISTQVRDVAMVLLLDHQGIDPREFGFAYLEADPLLGYRSYSLGFADQRDRVAAHQTARARIEQPDP